MFDFECQMRFWKSATDATFGYASATLAAVSIVQDHIQDEADGGARHQSTAPNLFADFNPFAPFAWWTAPQPSPPFMVGGFPDFARFFFPAAAEQSQPMHVWNPFAATSANPFLDPTAFFANPLFNNPWQSQWAEMMRSFGWPVPHPSWTMWQHPMTAALMAGGMPYSVASPTARANAAAMDAADAARDGFNKAFSSYQTGGGHATAQTATMPDLMSMMMAPWMAFAEPPPPAA